MWIYPWQISATNNFLRQRNKDPVSGRVYSDSLKDLTKDLDRLYRHHGLSKEGIVLLTPKSFLESFIVDGAHSDIWKITEKSLPSKKLMNLVETMKKLNFDVSYSFRGLSLNN